jgi:signal transduction histidine kinase
VTAKRLRDFEILVSLTDADCEWLAAAGELCHCPDGEVIIADGEKGNYLYLLLEGELVVSKVIYQHEQFLVRYEAFPRDIPADGRPPSAREFFGELPLLTDGHAFATIRACGQATLLRYTKDAFFEILARFPGVMRAMIPALVWRIKAAEMHTRNQGITAALGTMAAGLTHEIDNPAAAIMRAAGVLDEAMARLVASTLAWGALGTPAERKAVAVAAAAISPGALPGLDLQALDDAADELTAWAREQGAADPAGIGDTLASRGVTAGWLAERLEPLRRSAAAAALDHLGAALDVSEPLADIRIAITRITALVAEAAEYASLGRAPLRDFSVTQGLEATLAVLSARLAGVQVIRAYEPDLPTLLGYPSELNQAWTHVLDNAVDAMSGSGTITLAVSRRADSLLVEITDTGRGIPAESIDHIFRPFYTTKDIGQGTGLGLHLAHQIVTQRHGGSMTAHSVPGRTTLAVRLPISPP